MWEETKQKHIYAQAGIKTLVYGIIGIFLDIIIIVLFYGLFWGRFSELREGERIVLTNPSGFISLLAVVMFLLVFIGVLSGLLIGRYVESEFAKRRRQRQPQLPPPPP